NPFSAGFFYLLDMSRFDAANSDNWYGNTTDDAPKRRESSWWETRFRSGRENMPINQIIRTSLPLFCRFIYSMDRTTYPQTGKCLHHFFSGQAAGTKLHATSLHNISNINPVIDDDFF